SNEKIRSQSVLNTLETFFIKENHYDMQREESSIVNACLRYLGYSKSMCHEKMPIFMDIAFIEYCFNLSLDPSSFQNLPITQTQPDSQQILWEYSLISNALERLENIELERQNCMREDGLSKYTNSLLLNKETLNNEALKLYSCAKAGICRWMAFHFLEQEPIDHINFTKFLQDWGSHNEKEMEALQRLSKHKIRKRLIYVSQHKKKMPWSKFNSVLSRYIQCTKLQLEVFCDYDFKQREIVKMLTSNIN
uniref:Protection of telomeres protein poz1 n=1 Tax=Schizosaccharomyces pombe (strain 972 / ATCC 24843) TaxID=284812 RepID=UPI000C6C888E|nr:Chain A, Protection of telomeres protein poz1 [Schizosaccharomyces pombe 972h-]5WE0_D Chain D, Protection of telomeres protein poz1 [Schizosaccharomyces pombe 972h-]5WE0_G Chain G, Protection of telomeres protein poz1 [Schizosaccharomyces pombe 972h-]5WE0_J Chain J, Protection of telomeres protein poz1 [Schizosaccharomyces pombe 972h-]